MLLAFFQAEDGIRDKLVTGVQTCALPIFLLLRHQGVLVAVAAVGELSRSLINRCAFALNLSAARSLHAPPPLRALRVAPLPAAASPTAPPLPPGWPGFPRAQRKQQFL